MNRGHPDPGTEGGRDTLVTEKKPDETEPAPDLALPEFDTAVAHIARVYDYWLGGVSHFEVDRRAAKMAARDFPGIIRGVREQRAFLARAVRYLAAEQGIRQFLDIGTGIPSANNTHEVAQAAAPECRVVYVDNDPMVIANARALLRSDKGRSTFVAADLRDTGTILAEAQRMLDFSQPVAVLLIGILQLIPDADDPYAIVRRLVAAVPSGSWLAIAQPTGDVKTSQIAKAAGRFNQRASTPVTLRTHAEVSRFFAGTDLIPPGVVQLHRWRPLPGGPESDEDIPAYCGLARKTPTG